MNMKPKRSAESVGLRRDLARLLRRLRTTRQEHRLDDDLASRVDLALVEARRISHLVTFGDDRGARPAGTSYHDTGESTEVAGARLESAPLRDRGELAADCA
jgi:hypothetical protein